MSAANSAQDLWLGLDTGGTFTDAVLLADGRRVIASAKALTTPWNLALGIGEAIRTVLGLIPPGSSRADASGKPRCIWRARPASQRVARPGNAFCSWRAVGTPRRCARPLAGAVRPRS